MMFKQFMTCMSEKIDVMERKSIYNKIGAHYKEHVIISLAWVTTHKCGAINSIKFKFQHII